KTRPETKIKDLPLRPPRTNIGVHQRIEDTRTGAIGSMFDRIGRAVGDTDREHGGDLSEHLNCQRMSATRSVTSTSSTAIPPTNELIQEVAGMRNCCVV
ncbi:hypothetical protein PanWU01x14_321130, partial [Parasponia andersonii]